MTDALMLAADQLRARDVQAALPDSTDDVDAITTVIGQDRARGALDFGLAIPGEGYNIVVSGQPSSGRNVAVRNMVEHAASEEGPVDDWCYLHNFDDPYRPIARKLPPALGDDLERALNRVVEACRRELPQTFESESYQERMQEALRPMAEERDRSVERLQNEARRRGFAASLTPAGFAATPIGPQGQPLSSAALQELSEEDRASLEERRREVSQLIEDTMRELRQADANAREAIANVDRDVARFVVGGIIDDLRNEFGAYGLKDQFDAIENDIVRNLDQYKRFTESALAQLPPHVVAEMNASRERLLQRYAVNLFVSHGDEPAPAAPVVFEQSPTYYNLFGRVDYAPQYGALTTDFTQIRPGALHRANGGYLVLQLEELLSEPWAWLKLKRSLKAGEARVENLGEAWAAFPTVSLVPEPIPLALKVILVGKPLTVALLDALDPEFNELFKMRAEFEPDVDWTEPTTREYASFVRRTVDECALRAFDRGALAEVIHYGNRLAGRQDRLTTRFGAIQDLCAEANELARREGADRVAEQHVTHAIEGRRHRAGLVPDRMRRMIAEGTLHIETSGAVVGQANGLAVYHVSGQAFGVPIRITCRVGLGRRGIVAIEREVERSGAIHTKGVLVLTGYLMGTFGRDRPLAFTASLTFEQSYDEVEGDSASSAELYAILASLAEAPIRQDVAVTGSVDQFGAIQPVGGVTEKIEGFFDVCREVGLTGTQGVIVPRRNMTSLTLRPDVVQAVSEGEFHVWAIDRVEQGLEILTGMTAGSIGPDGHYREGTLFRHVSDALDEMRRRAEPSRDGAGSLHGDTGVEVDVRHA